jgi:hypothetical protein
MEMGNLLAQVVGTDSQAKEAIGANATKPSACSKIGPHALQAQQVFFSFRSIHACLHALLEDKLPTGLGGKALD